MILNGINENDDEMIEPLEDGDGRYIDHLICFSGKFWC